MSKKKMTADMRQAIIRCEERLGSMDLVEKAKWTLVIISKIREYKINRDDRAMVTSLYEEIQRETDDIRQIEALLYLAPCYYLLDNISGTLQLLKRADNQAKALRDINLCYRLRTEIMRGKCILGLWENFVNHLKELNDPWLWALAASCLDYDMIWHFCHDKRNKKALKEFRMILRTMFHSIPSLPDPADRAILYHNIIKTQLLSH